MRNYREAIAAGAKSMMTAYNELDGIPVMVHPKYGKNMIRSDFNFRVLFYARVSMSLLPAAIHRSTVPHACLFTLAECVALQRKASELHFRRIVFFASAMLAQLLAWRRAFTTECLIFSV